MFVDIDPELIKQQELTILQIILLKIQQWVVLFATQKKKTPHLPIAPTATTSPVVAELIPNTPYIIETPVKPESLLIPFANAIKDMEGYFQGSRSYKNSNPGNLKYSSYTKSLGATGKDSGGFCIFPDYAKGFSALCQFITDAADDKLKLCKKCTISSFIAGYAPSSDGNNPKKYSIFIAQKLKVKPDILLRDII